MKSKNELINEYRKLSVHAWTALTVRVIVTLLSLVPVPLNFVGLEPHACDFQKRVYSGVLLCSYQSLSCPRWNHLKNRAINTALFLVESFRVAWILCHNRSCGKQINILFFANNCRVTKFQYFPTTLRDGVKLRAETIRVTHAKKQHGAKQLSWGRAKSYIRQTYRPVLFPWNMWPWKSSNRSPEFKVRY